MEIHAQDVYVTYDNNYTKKRHPFFLQHGNHNYNQMASFFVGPRGAFHGLSIDTWGEYKTRNEAHREAQWLGEQVRKGFLTYKDHRLFVEAV